MVLLIMLSSSMRKRFIRLTGKVTRKSGHVPRVTLFTLHASGIGRIVRIRLTGENQTASRIDEATLRRQEGSIVVDTWSNTNLEWDA